MRAADVLVAVGGWLIRDRFVQPVAHWRKRTWDGFRAENHDALGAAYGRTLDGGSRGSPRTPACWMLGLGRVATPWMPRVPGRLT